jgi:hypothetical protein
LAKEFTQILKAHQVGRLVDVRTSGVRDTIRSSTEATCRPPSGAFPLPVHARLGGFRRTHPDSLNTGWHNASFRGFADYMQTPEFRKNLDNLIALAESERTAIMCAEPVPWRCHRSLIPDALLARGIEVREITSATRSQTHTLTPWGKIDGRQVTYSAERKQ